MVFPLGAGLLDEVDGIGESPKTPPALIELIHVGVSSRNLNRSWSETVVSTQTPDCLLSMTVRLAA